jgi:hypothetical protein
MWGFLRRRRPGVTVAELAAVDRMVATELMEIDRQLRSWRWAVNWPNSCTDYLLDERLQYRPVDVMASAGDWGLAA